MGLLFVPVGSILGYVIENCPAAGYTITFDEPFNSEADYTVPEPRGTVGADEQPTKVAVKKYPGYLIVYPTDDLAHVELVVIPVS